MSVTPREFAQLLHHSTLNPNEKEAILRLLPSFSRSEIDALVQILRKDNLQKETLIHSIEVQRDSLIQEFNEVAR